MENIKAFLANLSQHPGVYQMLDEKGIVLYVGKAKNLKKRVASYFSAKSKDYKTLTLVSQIHDINITVTASESEAVLLECNLIKKYQPRYNVLLRDDKSYPYIMISTQHEFPRIDLYRGTRKKNALLFGPYPSAGVVRETISLLQKVFRIRTCTDTYFEARTRPCLLYQIGRCTGPCVGLISQAEYAENVKLAVLFLQGKDDEVINVMQVRMEAASQALDFEAAAQYRDQISRLRQIQNRQYVSGEEGNADVIGYDIQAGIICIQLLSIRGGNVLASQSHFPKVPPHSSIEEILSAFITQHYFNHPSHTESIPKEIILNVALNDHEMIQQTLKDEAKHAVDILQPHRGEKKKWLAMAMNSAKLSMTAHLFTKTNMLERMRALQELLQLKNLPKRIECFDISHTMGEATVASCVVFNQEGPVKSDYRRFNIEGVKGGDDPAAMHQVLLRRFKRLQKEAAALPEVVLIDGGTIQLNQAKMVMDQLNIDDVLLVGVSKGPDRKAGFETLHRLDHPPVHLPADALALHFIQQIRDEAHRFAITGHRKRRDKTRRQSSLELITGVGAKRRRELLRYFGGIHGLAHASLDELMKVPGISRSLAERIFAALHDATL
jgi:excinuclease ABC subunit C